MAEALPEAAAGLEASEKTHTDQYRTMCLTSAAVVSDVTYKDSPGCRGWAASGGGWGALIGGDVERRSTRLSGDALLQIPETRVQT